MLPLALRPRPIRNSLTAHESSYPTRDNLTAPESSHPTRDNLTAHESSHPTRDNLTAPESSHPTRFHPDPEMPIRGARTTTACGHGHHDAGRNPDTPSVTASLRRIVKIRRSNEPCRATSSTRTNPRRLRAGFRTTTGATVDSYRALPQTPG
jgi:hypothetical protein